METISSTVEDFFETILLDLYHSRRNVNFRFGGVFLQDPAKYISIQFSDELQELSDAMEDFKYSAVNETSKDWAGAIECALKLDWDSTSKKIIVFMSDSDAQGKRFCGNDNHNEEEEKLVKLIEKLADDGFFFCGVNAIDDQNKNIKGCENTLNEIKKIYQSRNCNNFANHEKVFNEYRDTLPPCGVSLLNGDIAIMGIKDSISTFLES